MDHDSRLVSLRREPPAHPACGSHSARHAKRAVSGVVSVAVLLALLCCGGLDEEELSCEEAVSRLDECCPSFDDRAIDCVYKGGGCVNKHPAISGSQSRCIRAMSCGDLASRGVCARAQ